MQYPGSLHNHTDYSNFRLRDSINKIETLIDYAIELGHEVIAITDHETIASAVQVEEYYNKVKEKHPNFKVIRGNEIYLCRNGLNSDNFDSKKDKYYHFILLAKDLEGQKQIQEISTRAWMRSYMARGMRRVPTYYSDIVEIIGSNPGHVIGSTACLGGMLPTQLLRYRFEQSEELYNNIVNWCVQMDNLFGHGNFFLELQPSFTKEQIYVNRELITLADKLNIEYIITTDSHYLNKDKAAIHTAFLNAQDGDREVSSFYATTYLMDTDELETYMMLTREELDRAYDSILKIKNMCEDYSVKKPLKIPELTWKVPILYPYNNCKEYIKKIPYLKTFMESDYRGDKVLAGVILERLINDTTLQTEATYREINQNLEATWISSEVNKTHWSAYYLNLQGIIDTCWEAGSLVGPGRGSGVGFILLYILGITQINPLRETTKVFSWRFLNPDRVSVLDVDFDIEGGRRNQVLKAFRNKYGEDRVANVTTFRTEKSKSAILTAARGLGIDSDIAQYISSLIPSDRGTIRTLSECYYGDESKDYAPIKQFVYEMDENYPELWKTAKEIESLICGTGVHAGGVIFVDEPFTESTALMRAPDGTICTQFELHDSEKVSLIKYDALSVEAMDKIHNCLDLICDYGYAERKPTLKETYESMIGVYNLERTNTEMWKMVWNHKIQSLFQMEQQSGIQGIEILKPTTVDDLAILNSTIRLMAQEKGGEMPTEKLARFKRNPQEWLNEMKRFGLSKEQQKILEPILSISYGLCIAQEQFMELVQLPELGGFSLTWADKLRKSIAKKNPKDYEALTKEFYQVTTEKGIDQNFAKYVWDVLIAMSKGYGFNQSHTLAYSIIALQEMNLAFKYPIIFWNCACLISDSGGNEEEPEEVIENEDEDDEDDEEEKATKTKKKKVNKINYGKISTAIGQMNSVGIAVQPPDINKSSYTFIPDIENNKIIYGIKGITRIGTDLVNIIIENRPYESMLDFLSKVKVNKLQMINLIKSGAFDNFGNSREEVMKEYIDSISDKKKNLTLANVPMLIENDLISDEYSFEIQVYNFNKYLKKHKQDDYGSYELDEIAESFYRKHFDEDLLEWEEISSGRASLLIDQKTWDKIYSKIMDSLRAYIKDNKEELLNKLNTTLFNNTWKKYCDGNLSKWEMDSVSFYSHEHELAFIDEEEHNISDFYSLPEEPVVVQVAPFNGKEVPIFNIERIAGTVLDKNKNKHTVTLLTNYGVVIVKVFQNQFAQYDRQLSIKLENGKKKVVEKSWFSRGNKLIFTGIRRGSEFFLKKYKRTPYSIVELITNINEDGTIETKKEREVIE